jgi:hypothetical protein
MKVIVSTCDKYINCVEALKYTFDKNGGSDFDVTILGFKEPNFDYGNWKFFSMGTDVGPQNLSNDLWTFFKDFDDEIFLWLNDDIVLVDGIDIELLNEMKDMILNNKSIGRITATSATKNHYGNYPIYEVKDGYEYREVPQNAEYRLSLNSSIWRTSYFKKYCQQGAGNWVWETRSDALNDGYTILGTIGRYAIDFGHLFRFGNLHLSHNWYMSEYTNKTLSVEDKNKVENIINNNYNLLKK